MLAWQSRNLHCMTFCAPPAFSVFAPVSTARCTRSTALTRKRPKASANREENDDTGDDDLVVSRRIFNFGILASGTGVAWVGSRLVVGDDLKDQARKAIRTRFPSFFPTGPTPAERRNGPPDLALATAYYDACADVAAKQGLIKRDELMSEEDTVRQRAASLFFKRGEPPSANLTDPDWLNFALYARLHVIEARTSPAQRLSYSRALARRTLPLVGASPPSGDVLTDVRGVLDVLVNKHWISGYKISDFDDVVWREERTSPLTVFAYDPVTIQCAQLLGEEAYAEISPVLSPWLVAILEDGGVSVTAEDYYLDSEYSPDPADYAPSVLATEFDLSAT